MEECRDFFDEPTSEDCRSSAFAIKASLPTPPGGTEEVGADCLELTLGLGPSVGSFQASRPLQVRPESVYTCLPKQPSGNFTSSVTSIPTSDASQTSICQGDGSKVTGRADATTLAKQRSGNFSFPGTQTHPRFGGQADTRLAANAPLPSGDSAFSSRDQIWLTLQKNGAVFGQDMQHTNEASSMWSRRSASMHVMIPHKDVGDEERDKIRRSCSGGVFPPTLSGQIRGVEFSLEKSPQQSMLCSQDQDQEALEELRKRKEMQAQRRQEARKRRKVLIEEKQHKKSKQSSILPRLGSRRSVSPNDKISLAGGEDGATPELHSTSHDELKQEGQGKVRKGMIMIQNLHTEEAKQETHSQCKKDDKIELLASSSTDEVEGLSHHMHSKGGIPMHGYSTPCSVHIKDGVLNWLPHAHNSGSHGSMMASEFDQSTSLNNCVMGSKFLTTINERNHTGLHNSHAVIVSTLHTGACMNEDGGKSNETECEESCNIRNNAKLFQCTSEKGGVGAMLSSALSTASMASGSTNCPPFPCLAVPNPYTVAVATPTAIPIQPGFPFPFLMQYPGSSNSDHDLASLHGKCPIVTATTPGTSPPGALISKASLASKDCMGETFEEKGGSSEKPAFTSLSRTASNLKHVKEESQCLGIQLESQVTFPASQLSSLSSVVSDACNNKNSLLERQQSMPLGGGLLSQNSSVQDQSTLSSVQKRPILTQRSVDVLHETSTLRTGTEAERKQVEGFKQERGNVESQLTSEQSGVDASYVQSGRVERQKSGSFPDLPWVTTTGKGPNGKTINGVMYIVSGRHVRLVCSCHGKHMSPVEFVEHSGSTDLSHPERNIVVCAFPSLTHQLTSAPV